MTAHYLVREAEFEGFSSNPYRRGGSIARFTRWMTIARCPSRQEAHEFLERRTTGLFKRGIWHRGKRLE
jgi:hypothetical protein